MATLNREVFIFIGPSQGPTDQRGDSMPKNVSTDLVPRVLGTNLDLAALTPKALSRALRDGQRQAFVAVGMTDAVFQHQIGSQAPEDRLALAARMQKLAQSLAFLAEATKRGSLEMPELEELPWNSELDRLPNMALRNVLKDQFLAWQESGLSLEAYMDGHRQFALPQVQLKRRNGK